ncbi:MAG: CDP-diacylglycerol--glycerol-3-phosphate 3-phosphatidyltransferase [Clostridiales Family XIII bacterium]|jgi:CDP-diacylglycerol--glycerol-3-phosphate 3-phosphatidyltransferase|nr:CDP-diacylglycerol--glycerol-3-phosphate 3-phosphatidyltransferase [Clostridiales Family XIII bacterium]
MNLPNFLTILRMALVPVFIVFYYLGQGGSRLMAALALAVFVIAAATDAIDGHIARSRNMITNFGKLMDPLADKVLTTAAFICFVAFGVIPAWVVIVIIAREFLITGLRSVAADQGVVIAAGLSGKIKTVLQMLCVALILLDTAIGNGPATHGLWVIVSGAGIICLYAAVVLTVWSGVEYVWKARHLLNLK